MKVFIIVSIHLEDRGQDAVGVSDTFPTRKSAEQMVISDAQRHWQECNEGEEELDGDCPKTYTDAVAYLFEVDEDVEVREIEVQS
jgi:hypothetical protein